MPYTDNTMRYDAAKHRYILTEDHVLEGMNIDLRDILNTSASADTANDVSRFLDRVSRIVYDYAYRVAALRFTTERSLALEDGARDFILRSMEEQLLYMLNNGDLSAYAGVNLQTGMSIDAKRLRSAEIAPLACDALMESGCICAVIPKYKTDIKPSYDTEGY